MESKKVGEILRSEREKKGLSLHEIGMSLKINPKILKAIEDSDSTQLPAKTFLRGFVRSYAQYLRLDGTALLNQLQKEMSPNAPLETLHPLPTTNETVEEAPKEKTKNNDKPAKATPLHEPSGISGRKLVSLLGTALLIVLIIFVAKMVDKYQKESTRPKIEIDESKKLAENPEPGKSTTVETPASTAEALVSGMAPVDSTPTIQVSSGPAPTPNPTPVVIATPAPTSTPHPTATPVVIPKATPTPAPVAATPTPALTETAANNGAATPTPAPKTVEVIVEALNNVEIRYTFNNEKWETIALVTDEIYTFKSKTGIKLEISDGGSISLIVNGRERGVPGAIGKPIKLSYPK